MKKMRYFFTCILALVGLGTAQADGQYEQGTEVTDIAAVAEAGTEVVLQAPATSPYSASKFLSPTGMVDVINSSCLYKLEATGEDVDGYPTYRLINVEKGMYLKYEDYSSYYDSSDMLDNGHDYTSDVSNAYVFTALHPIAGSEDGRTTVDENQTLVEDAWILACDKTVNCLEGKNLTGYFGMIGVGFFSSYSDTNQWLIYEAQKLGGVDELSAYISSTFPDGLVYYAVGTNPGQVPSEQYNALSTAYNAAIDLCNSSSASEAECTAAMEALEAAKAAADAAVVSVEDGKYYFIMNKRSDYYVYADASGNKIRSASFTIPTTADEATIAAGIYLWKVTAATDGQWYLQNLYTGTYMGATGTTYYVQDLTETPDAAFTIEYNTNNENAQAGLFNIYNSTLTYHIDSSNNMVPWNEKSGAGCLFTFTEATDIANALADQIAQEKINSSFESLLYESSELYNRGRNYTSSGATEDGLFDETGLVVDASALSTNAQESSEGPIENLVDGDFTTYFHSAWSSAADPAGYHYVQADLGETVQNLVIKYAKRHNNINNAPMQIRVYGTNDVDGTWNYCGDYTLSYPYTISYSTTDDAGTATTTEKENYAGVRGIELTGTYRYVRIEAIVTANNAYYSSTPGCPFFTLSELRFFDDGVYDAASSGSFEAVDATVAATLKSEIAKAAEIVAAGTATQEDIDRLQAAYDAFVAQYPDIQVLRDAITEAQTVVTNYAEAVGTELGYYTQDTYDALSATITEVEATIPEDGSMSLAEIQSGVQKLEAAVAALKASLIYPEAGKYYVLRGMTTNESNTRALGAYVYSTGNSTTAYLKSAAQTDGQDEVSPADDITAIWKVVSCSDGKIVLQNVGTGFYIGEQSSLNGAIRNVAEPTEIGIQGISTGGGFNLVVGEGLYVNFQGQGENMVAWNTASGTDNSSIKFEEFSVDDFGGAICWNVTANVNQIITLPVAVYAPSSDMGTTYSVLGQKETDGTYTIELQTISDDAEFEAGMPFVFKPASGVTRITFALSDLSIEDIAYATSGKTTSNGTLTGVLAADTITENATVILNNGVARILGTTTNVSGRVAAANTGYIHYVATEETGDAQIELSGDMQTTGIANATITDANTPVDVYTITGVRVRTGVKAGAASNGLPAGIYVIGGQKVLVK